MEEKQKVWVKGVPGRGNEVIKTLQDLGGKNMGLKEDSPNQLYYITHDGCIDFELLGCEAAHIIMDNYKEIQLPQKQWKDGDVLVNNNYPDCYAVFKKYNDNGTFEAYFFLYGKTALFDTTSSVEGYHRASTEELKEVPLLFTFLMGALNEAGLCLPKKVEQK